MSVSGPVSSLCGRSCPPQVHACKQAHWARIRLRRLDTIAIRLANMHMRVHTHTQVETARPRTSVDYSAQDHLVVDHLLYELDMALDRYKDVNVGQEVNVSPQDVSPNRDRSGLPSTPHVVCTLTPNPALTCLGLACLPCGLSAGFPHHAPFHRDKLTSPSHRPWHVDKSPSIVCIRAQRLRMDAASSVCDSGDTGAATTRAQILRFRHYSRHNYVEKHGWERGWPGRWWGAAEKVCGGEKGGWGGEVPYLFFCACTGRTDMLTRREPSTLNPQPSTLLLPRYVF
jgi:hypothetical protein